MRIVTARALVTGASGFIGAHLVRHLRRRGWRVAVLARPGSRTDCLEHADAPVAVHRYDGTSASVCQALEAERPDVVLHLASCFLVNHRPEDLDALVDGNIRFGLHLADAMVRTGCARLVAAGTSWQHWNDADYRPVNLYAATKQACDALFAYYRDAGSLRLATLALFDTYGPGDTRRKIIPLLQEALRTGKPLDLSPGAQRLDFLHVEDAAAAFRHAAEGLLAEGADALAPGEYAIRSGTRVSLRELAALIESVVGRPLPVHWGVHPYRPREVMEPWTRGNSLPGWRPAIGLREGLETVFCPGALSAGRVPGAHA